MQRLHRGVFLLGAAPPTRMARARAAVLACGEGAAVSHRSAAEMFGLLPETIDGSTLRWWGGTRVFTRASGFTARGRWRGTT